MARQQQGESAGFIASPAKCKRIQLLCIRSTVPVHMINSTLYNLLPHDCCHSHGITVSLDNRSADVVLVDRKRTTQMHMQI